MGVYMEKIIHTINEDIRLSSMSIIGIDCLPTVPTLELIDTIKASLVKDGYDVTIIDVEDFHNPVHFYHHDENVFKSYYYHGHDYTTLVKEIITPLTRGEMIKKDILLLDRHLETYSYKKFFSINNPSVIIIYGANIFIRPLSMYFTKKIFLNYDTEERLTFDSTHALNHYFDEGNIVNWWAWYVNNAKPHQHSDITIYQRNNELSLKNPYFTD